MKNGKKSYYNKYILGLLILLIFTVSCGKKKEQKVEEDLRPVKTILLNQSDMSLGYTAGAEIKGKEEIPY